MYGIDLSVQFENLMPALGLGFILAFVYDVIVFIRKTFFHGKVFLFLSDMIYVMFCTVSSVLLFFAVNSGHIRSYLVLAEVLAAAVYRMTAGMLISLFTDKVSAFFGKIINRISSPFVFLEGKITFFFTKIRKNMRKMLKKFKINSENPLKDNIQM